MLLAARVPDETKSNSTGFHHLPDFSKSAYISAYSQQKTSLKNYPHLPESPQQQGLRLQVALPEINKKTSAKLALLTWSFSCQVHEKGCKGSVEKETESIRLVFTNTL